MLRGVQFLGIHATLVDTKPELVGPNVTDNVKEGRSYSAEDVAQAMFAQGRYYRDWQTFFETHDYLISGSNHQPHVRGVSCSPPKLMETDKKLLPLASHGLRLDIPGHPSITIPCGFDANNMPFGLQIVGRRHDDLGVLAVANELEAIIASISDLAPTGPDLALLKMAAPISQAEGFLNFE